MSDEERENHDALVRSVDVKLEKIDRKLSLAAEYLKEAHNALDEVRRVEFLVSKAKEEKE